MPVVTKFKIYKSGKMEAGQFIEDSDTVQLNVRSEAHVSALDETGDTVKFKNDGTVVANEFVEL